MATGRQPSSRPLMLFPRVDSQSDINFWVGNALEGPILENFTVTRIVHYKCKDRKQHEFLLVYTRHPSFGVALLCIDRSPKPEHTTSGNLSSRTARDTLSMLSSSPIPAMDRVIVSADGTEQIVTKYFGPSYRLRTLTYPENSLEPSLAQFATLLLVAIQDDYQLYNRSCYWLARVTWEALMTLFPHGKVTPERRNLAPSVCWNCVVPRRYEPQAIVDQYEAEWQKFTQNAVQKEEQHRQEESKVGFI
jgi:hypothetical protein